MGMSLNFCSLLQGTGSGILPLEKREEGNGVTLLSISLTEYQWNMLNFEQLVTTCDLFN